MDKQTVRRKILQGTLAAPVVLTVSSASAQAVTSFGKCLANLAGQQPTEVFTNSADTWFRSQVPVVKILKGSLSQGIFYFDPKIGSYVSLVSPYSAFTGFAGATPFPPYSLESAGSRWALVYFHPTSATPYTSATGTTIITTQPPSNYLASSWSCYGSFTTRI
jgi:hypothetical protein